MKPEKICSFVLLQGTATLKTYKRGVYTSLCTKPRLSAFRCGFFMQPFEEKDKKFADAISGLEEVQTLLLQQSFYKSSLRKVNRKLKTINQHHAFLATMFYGNDSAKFELAITAFFKDIGYKSVKWTGKGNDKEDVQIWHEQKVTLCELKNSPKSVFDRDDLTQVHWRKTLRQDSPELKDYEIRKLIVVNNEHLKSPIEKRRKIPLDKPQIEYINGAKESFVTTLQLFQAYIWIKEGRMSLQDFDEQLHSPGIVEFKIEGGL